MVDPRHMKIGPGMARLVRSRPSRAKSIMPAKGKDQASRKKRAVLNPCRQRIKPVAMPKNRSEESRNMGKLVGQTVQSEHSQSGQDQGHDLHQPEQLVQHRGPGPGVKKKPW